MGIRCRIDSSRGLNRFNMMKIDKPEGFKILKVGGSLHVIGPSSYENYPLYKEEGLGILDWKGVESPRWPEDVKSLTVNESNVIFEFTEECSARLDTSGGKFGGKLTFQRRDFDTKIAFACGMGDSVVDYLIDSGLVNAEVLYTKRWLESPGEDVPDEEDPSGFTEVGRELFEFVYGLIVDY